jgi:hypothetical protein
MSSAHVFIPLQAADEKWREISKSKTIPNFML